MSRLSRSTQELCELIDIIREKRLRLVIMGSITINCREGKADPMSEAFMQMAGVFSQLELAMIRARVKSGMANAKAKGRRIGRRTHTCRRPYGWSLPRRTHDLGRSLAPVWETGAWGLNGQHILGQLDHHTAIMAEPMEAAGNSRRRCVEAGIQVYAAVIVHPDAGVKGELIVLASSPDYPVVIVHMTMEYAFVAQLHPS